MMRNAFAVFAKIAVKHIAIAMILKIHTNTANPTFAQASQKKHKGMKRMQRVCSIVGS